MEKLTIIKVGGKIVEEPTTLKRLIADFSKIEGKKILVHGGGRSATNLATDLGVETKMIDGRRITDKAMLQIVTMVYGGLVNKTIVAELQALGINAIGLTGADMNIVLSEKRPVKTIDYGWVGDVKSVQAESLVLLLNGGFCPVIAPLTHDGMGHMLNTNADTMAGEVAKAMAKHYETSLIYCFEKAGVLADENDDNSFIAQINQSKYAELKETGVVTGGMIPKLDNAFACVNANVAKVTITRADLIAEDIGTIICK